MSRRARNHGFVFTQEDVDIGNAADWQYSFNSSWRFFEIVEEREEEVVIPEYEPSSGEEGLTVQTVDLLSHGLGFIPAYEAGIIELSDSNYIRIGFRSTDEKLMLFRTFFLDDDEYIQSELTVKFRYRIFNIPIDLEYEAEPIPRSRDRMREGEQGAAFLDQENTTQRLDRRSNTGYASDTSKRVLSVHKSGTHIANPKFYYQAQQESVDTSSDEITLSPTKSPQEEWLETGQAVEYEVGVGGEPPGGISEDTIYYVIRTSYDPIRVQLAATESDAESGSQINLTSEGDSGGGFQGLRLGISDDQNDEDNKLVHNLGYTPSFRFAIMTYSFGGTRETIVDDLMAKPLDPSQLIGEKKRVFRTASIPYVNANPIDIEFRGFQAVVAEKIGYIIIKDPAEVVF